jgi:hypothetical protein
VEPVNDRPWGVTYETEQTFTLDEDETPTVVAYLGTLSASKEQALKCAAICFQQLVRRGAPGKG